MNKLLLEIKHFLFGNTSDECIPRIQVGTKTNWRQVMGHCYNGMVVNTSDNCDAIKLLKSDPLTEVLNHTLDIKADTTTQWVNVKPAEPTNANIENANTPVSAQNIRTGIIRDKYVIKIDSNDLHPYAASIIRYERKKRSLTQTDIAIKCQVSQGFYWKLENNETSHGNLAWYIPLIARALNVDFRTFLKYESLSKYKI